MNIRWTKTIILTLLLFFVLAQAAFAFTDIKGDPAENAIVELKKQGIINGINEHTFAPDANLTYAMGVHLMVKAFDLNMDHFRFIKEPLASDYYQHVPDDKWFSHSFVSAHLNGITLPQNVKPNDRMTKEQFADLLYQAMISKHDLAFIELWIEIKDEAAISSSYMNSIQKLIISDITPLEDGKFYPKKQVTRSEAASLLHKTLLFLEQVHAGQ